MISEKETRIKGVKYTTVPLPFDAAFDLGLEIAAIVGGPLGTALNALLSGGELDPDDLGDDFFAGAGEALAEVPARLLKAGGAEFIARLVATTTRIGADDQGPIKQALSDPEQRTAAWGGGNMLEAILAVKWVLEVNYGPFLMELWELIRKPLSELGDTMNLTNLLKKAPESTNTSESDSLSGLKPTEKISSIS